MGVAAGLGVLGIVAVTVAALAGIIAGVLVGTLLGVSLLVIVGLALALAHFVGFVGLAAAYLRQRGYDSAQIQSYIGVARPTGRELGYVVAGNLGIVLLLATLLAVVDLFSLLPTGTGVPDEQAELFDIGFDLYLAIVLFMLVVVGPTEEVLYRGVIQNRLREQFEAGPAIAIASVVFTAIHLQIYTFGAGAVGVVVGFLALFIPSLVLGAVYEHTGNIVVPSLVHGIHNSILVTVVVFGPPVVTEYLTF